jgi:hypothetical protein
MKDRNYTYLQVDELIKKVLLEDEKEFKFVIQSKDGYDQDLFSDFGINEMNCINHINDIFNDQEIDYFKRIFLDDKQIIICDTRILFDGDQLEAFVTSPFYCNNISHFYSTIFSQGFGITELQLLEIFGKKYHPLNLIIQKFSNLGYEFLKSEEFDDMGLMYNTFIKNDKKYHLIGPQIDRKDLLDTKVFFDLYYFDFLLECYGSSMIEIPDNYLSFGEFFLNAEDNQRIENYLISEEDFNEWYLDIE